MKQTLMFILLLRRMESQKKIDYEGTIENFEDAMKTVEKTIFK